jgi:hypothetical protein
MFELDDVSAAFFVSLSSSLAFIRETAKDEKNPIKYAQTNTITGYAFEYWINDIANFNRSYWPCLR